MKYLRTIIFASTLALLSAVPASAITWAQSAAVTTITGTCDGTVVTDKSSYAVGDTMTLSYDILAKIASSVPVTGTVTCDATAVSNSGATEDFTYDYVGPYPDLLTLPIQYSSAASTISPGFKVGQRRMTGDKTLTVPSLSNGSHYISYAFYDNTEDATVNQVKEDWVLDTLSFTVAPAATVKVCFGGSPCP